MDLAKIALKNIKSAISGETTTLGSVWKDNPTVVIFFRRWGCMFCRLWAKELSEIAPILSKNNVKLVGVGYEDLGKEEFVEGKFFDGDLYVISEKKTYEELGFNRFSMLSVLASLLWKESREATSKGRAMKVGGNLKGDGLQNGGALIIGKDGKILNHFIQNGPAEHMPNAAILQILGLEDQWKASNEPETKNFEGTCMT